MKYKVVTGLLSLTLALSGMSTAAFAATESSFTQPAASITESAAAALEEITKLDLDKEDGKLMITEAGSYVLTGKLTGCVYVDPGEGDVELILDGVDIDGDNGAGIAVVSGDSLTVTLPENSISRVTDGRSDGSDESLHSAIYSKIDTVFEGDGSLYVTGSDKDSIQVKDACLTINSGNYAIKAPGDALSAKRIIINGGHFSIQAANTFAPDAETIVNGGYIDEVASESTSSDSSSSSDKSDSSSDSAANTAKDSSKEAAEEKEEASKDNSNTSTAAADSSSQSGSSGQKSDQQPPALPNGQQGSTSGQQAPSDGQQSQMPGNSQQTVTGTTDTASDVVYGTMTNSAANLEADYDNATYITVTDDENSVEITSSGTYVVTGTCSDGNITVKKGTTGVVLVLEDLDLTSTTGATVSVNKEAEVKIIISGNVVLTDNENPEDEDSEDEEVADAFDGAALKTKANSQVYVTGDGTLVINGNAKNGIKAGDDSSLIFDGVTVNINAVNDGINSNYDLTLLSGNFTISAGDDAIHADHILTIGDEDGNGPTIKVTESTEGLEGTVVNILGGDISITSSDDAINAANGDGLYEGVLDYSFNMLGGKVVINATGDGIDSNGDVNLIDGSAQIKSGSTGGEAGIDYVGDLYISDDFNLNNQSGTAADGAMGEQMPGQEMGQAPDQNGGQAPEQNSSQAPDQNGGQAPSQGGGQAPEQGGGQAPGQGGPSGGQMPGRQ